MTCLWQLALQSFRVALNSVNHSDKPQAQIRPGVVATFMQCSVLPSMKSLLSQLLGVLGVTTLSALPLRGLPQVQRATRPKGSVPDDFLRWFRSSAWCRNIQFQPFEPSWGQLWRAILAQVACGSAEAVAGPTSQLGFFFCPFFPPSPPFPRSWSQEHSARSILPPCSESQLSWKPSLQYTRSSQIHSHSVSWSPESSRNY